MRLSLRRAPELPEVVRNELQSLVSNIRTFLSVEHDDSGHHTNVHFAGSFQLTPFTPAPMTANTHNYAPVDGHKFTYWRISATGAIQLTGIDATNMANGQTIWLSNVGTQTITLVHESASSFANNRMAFWGAANRPLHQNAGIFLIRDATLGRWLSDRSQ